MEVSANNLKIGGSVLMKTLHGNDEPQAYKMYKIFFKDLIKVKPKASRSRSSEIFYLGLGFGMSKEYACYKKIEEMK